MRALSRDVIGTALAADPALKDRLLDVSSGLVRPRPSPSPDAP